MRKLEQIRGYKPFSGEEMLFIILKPGQCIFAVGVGGAVFPLVCASKQIT